MSQCQVMFEKTSEEQRHVATNPQEQNSPRRKLWISVNSYGTRKASMENCAEAHMSMVTVIKACTQIRPHQGGCELGEAALFFVLEHRYPIHSGAASSFVVYPSTATQFTQARE